MSALSVLTDAAILCGLDKPGLSFSAPEEFETRQIISFINDTARDLAMRGDWSRMTRKQRIESGADRATLPDDFARVSAVCTMDGKPLSPITHVLSWEWAAGRLGEKSYFRLLNGEIHFTPALSHTVFLHYILRHWVVGVRGGKQQVDDDTDRLLVPDFLVAKGAAWRWKRNKGRTFDDSLAEFESDFETALKADRLGQGA